MLKWILKYWKGIACLLIVAFAAQHLNASWSLYQLHLTTKLNSVEGEARSFRQRLRGFELKRLHDASQSEINAFLKQQEQLGLRYLYLAQPSGDDLKWGTPLSTRTQQCAKHNTRRPLQLDDIHYLVLKPPKHFGGQPPQGGHRQRHRPHHMDGPPTHHRPPHKGHPPKGPRHHRPPHNPHLDHHPPHHGDRPPRHRESNHALPPDMMCNQNIFPPPVTLNSRQPPYLAYEFIPVKTHAKIQNARANFYRTIIETIILALIGLVIVTFMQLRERQKQRLRDQRLTAKLGKMTALVSHELRNPLSASIGQAELLAEQIDTFLAHDLETQHEMRTLIDELSHIENLSDLLLETIRNDDTEGQS